MAKRGDRGGGVRSFLGWCGGGKGEEKGSCGREVKGRRKLDGSCQESRIWGLEKAFLEGFGAFWEGLDNKYPCIPSLCALTVTHHSKR